MKNKSHNKAKSLHIVQEIPNSKTCFIGRITQKSMLKSLLTPLPLLQVQQIQVPAPLSSRVLARKVIKTNQLKTQPSFASNEMKSQQSIFQLVASQEFQNIITEEKSKRDEDRHFSLEGPVDFKFQQRQKVFSTKPSFEHPVTPQDETLNIQIFLKKIKQIMTTSHISHEENHTNENSFLSDKFKTQLTSPRFTFTNHLSTIQFQNQPTQLQKAGTIFSQVLDAIEEKKEPQQPATQIRKKLTITVCSPENQVGFLSFSVPDYVQKLQTEPTEYVREYTDKPKHVLKQALQFVSKKMLSKISSQPKRVTSKFSKSILKIVGITEEENQLEDVHQFYNLQKTRRFMKMYLQNKMSCMFSKLEESILLHLELITEKRGSISYSKPSESQQSSRLYSWCTNPANSNHESLSNPTYYVDIENNRFVNTQQLNFSWEQSDEYDSSCNVSVCFDLIQCSCHIRVQQLSQYIHSIISGLDGSSRNFMLQELDEWIDTKMLHDQFDGNRDNQIQRNVNHWVQFLKRKDRIACAKTTFVQYNDILTGVFEDEHEINDLTTDYGLIEVEEYQQPQLPPKIDIAKIFVKSTQPSAHKHSKSHPDQSPPAERSNIKQQKIIANSPRHQTINQTTNTFKPNKQLLEATSSQTSVLRRRSDSPQEETSIKENSNTNTTQSNKMKNTQTVQNTTAPASQKDVTKPVQPKNQQERRNAVVISSMSKHALQMRTQITEARRRQSIPVLEIIKLLIEEQKLTELEELFSNNPNLPMNERLKDGNTYLILAAQTGCQEIVELLLHKGAQVNLQNDSGDTALHKAIVYNFYNIADLLISQGAQNLRNKEGQTPWQLAQ